MLRKIWTHKGILLIILGISTSFALFKIRRKNRRKLKRENSIRTKNADIGAIFGLDVGGTLCKLVYFEEFKPTTSWEEQNSTAMPHSRPVQLRRRKQSEDFQEDHSPSKQLGSSATPQTMKKSWSMVDLEAVHHHEALEQFYRFMENESVYSENLKEEDVSFYSQQLGGRLHFLKFETRHMDRAIDLIATNKLHHNIQVLGCTGGGAHKFAQEFLEKLNVRMLKLDEMDCMVRGTQFVVGNVISEFYTYRASQEKQETDPDIDDDISVYDEAFVADGKQNQKKKDRKERTKRLGKKIQTDYTYKVNLPNTELAKYPYLLVSIGSGVSFLKVDGPNQYERVSGSSIGGGTFYGLSRVLTKCADYEEVLSMSREGDSTAVDMLVGDIYGSGYDRFELSSDTVASSFGKLVMTDKPQQLAKEADFVKGLLIMITMNIGQIAYLNAKLVKTKKICFIGTFLRKNQVSCQRLAYAIDYWSGGKMEALFFKHEGYLGALGAFLQSGCWDEKIQPLQSILRPEIPFRQSRSFSADMQCRTEIKENFYHRLPKHVEDKLQRPRKAQSTSLLTANSSRAGAFTNQNPFDALTNGWTTSEGPLEEEDPKPEEMFFEMDAEGCFLPHKLLEPQKIESEVPVPSIGGSCRKSC